MTAPDLAASSHLPETGEDDEGRGFARCSCGQWEALVTGIAAARWALADYRRHLDEVAPS